MDDAPPVAEQAALREQLERTLRAADAALALRLAFEALAERTRVALMKPQLVAAIDGGVTSGDVDQLRAELAEIEGMRDTLGRLARC